jgi:hypothetical protein
MKRARLIALWVFGLFASAIVGGVLATRYMSYGMELFGAAAAMCAFACARLWSTETRKDT